MLENLEKSFIRCDQASPRYVLLHTLSHLLIRALSFCCGYDASSLKERIYASWPQKGAIKMAGVLIYTAWGMMRTAVWAAQVAQAEPDAFGRALARALEKAAWCSADPLCMESFGKNGQGIDGLNYAACHQYALLTKHPVRCVIPCWMGLH